MTELAEILLLVLGFLLIWQSPVLPMWLGVEDLGRQVLMGFFQGIAGLALIVYQLEKGGFND